MPIRVEISRLDRLVVLVARGRVTPDDIRHTIEALIAGNVRHFGKIIDVTGASTELTRDQIEGIAATMRSIPGSSPRGPVAFVIDPDRTGFAEVFSDLTQGDRPVRLFRSLHNARVWLKDSGR